MKVKGDKNKHCIIIGAMKCGTTALFRSLSNHCSSINVSKVKDTKFFVEQDRGGNWEKGWGWYLEMFPPSNGILLEASTHYTKYPYYPGVPARIKASFQEVKLVYLVRDPLQRALSHFFHNLFVDGEALAIDQAFSTKSSKYIQYSDYALQLSQYYDYFDRDVILVINLVDAVYQKESLEMLENFLGIEHIADSFVFERINTVEQNLDRFQKKQSLHARVTTFSKDNVALALELGLSTKNLRKIIQLSIENAERFQAFCPFPIDHWLNRYQTYL